MTTSMVDSTSIAIGTPIVNPQEKIQFHSFVGYWAGKNFFGGKTNIIKDDGTWTVPGAHEDGTAWWNHKGMVNLKRAT